MTPAVNIECFVEFFYHFFILDCLHEENVMVVEEFNIPILNTNSNDNKVSIMKVFMEIVVLQQCNKNFNIN